MNGIFPFSWECHHPKWRTHIFQRGRLNHQPGFVTPKDWVFFLQMFGGKISGKKGMSCTCNSISSMIIHVQFGLPYSHHHLAMGTNYGVQRMQYAGTLIGKDHYQQCDSRFAPNSLTNLWPNLHYRAMEMKKCKIVLQWSTLFRNA